MTDLPTVMTALRSKASEKTRATYLRHGAPADRTLGVSVANLKLIAKTIRRQQALACELYDTGVFEAMYLAGLVANGAQLSEQQLQSWASSAARMPMIFEYTVPWVAVESAEPRRLAAAWIRSTHEHVAAAGWCTLIGLVATRPDDQLDLREIQTLLRGIPAAINAAPNRVRSSMNRFVIAVGTYIPALFSQATAIAAEIGEVAVDVGDTACEIPLALDRIAKMQASGRAGIKRKTIRC